MQCAPNSKLALTIPTYNRPNVILQNLRIMLPELMRYSIAVYISDDSSNSQTQILVEQLKSQYPFIFYRRNHQRFGHDANFFASLGMANTDFIWYLGDSVFVKPGGLAYVLDKLDEDFDFYFVNVDVVDDVDRTFISSIETHQFLIDRTWYLTLSGATIYGRRSRSFLNSEENTSRWHNFPQLGLILAACSSLDVTFQWIGKNLIEINKNKKSYWQKSAFSVFVRDWSNLIRSFPKIFTRSESNKVIKSHSRNTGLFGYVSLVYLRSINALNFSILKEYEDEFRFASAINPFWAYIACCIPRNICAVTWNVASKCKKLLVF